MRFSLATATAAALPFLLTLTTTTATDAQKAVVEPSSSSSSSIPSSEEPTTMVFSTPLVIARQEANLAPALPPPSPASSSSSSAGLRGTPTTVADENERKAATTAVETTTAIQDKWEKKEFWNVFYSNGDRNQIRDLGNNRMSITIAPWKEAVSAQSTASYSGGRLEFKVKSAAVMPGIITAVYFASGNGRTGDSALGNQDEIDLEFKGNDPTRVQTNVFMNGQENLQMVDLGYDSSSDEHLYAVEWDNQAVKFMVDGREARSVSLTRPLQNMQLHLSVWTTTGGWPGLIQWGGYPNWGARGNQPVETILEITEYPTQSAH